MTVYVIVCHIPYYHPILFHMIPHYSICLTNIQLDSARSMPHLYWIDSARSDQSARHELIPAIYKAPPGAEIVHMILGAMATNGADIP